MCLGCGTEAYFVGRALRVGYERWLWLVKARVNWFWVRGGVFVCRWLTCCWCFPRCLLLLAHFVVCCVGFATTGAFGL